MIKVTLLVCQDFHINRHGRSMVIASATTKNESHLLPNSWKDFHINCHGQTWFFTSVCPQQRIKVTAGCRDFHIKFSKICENLINNGNSAEKYWLANALANKHSRQNLIYLRKMTKDKSINVKCASIRAISKISCSKTDIMLFKKTIAHSPDWYVQNTAYNALKRCL